MNSLLDSIALEYADEHKNTNFGNFRIWGSIGFAAGGLIAGKIISVVAMKYIFVLASLLLFAGWILLLFIRTAKSKGEKSKEPLLKGLIPIFTNRNIVGFLILNTCVAISIQSVWAFYTVYLNKIGASNQILGVGIMLQALVELPFYPIAYYIIKRFGLIRAISISIFFTALRLFLYSGISNPYLALPIECLQGLSYILNILAAIEYLNITVPVQWRATGQALFASTYFGVGAIVGNWWAGFLIDEYGIQRMYFINGLIISLTFIFSFFIQNKIYEHKQVQLTE
jgi:PPP family 3-phenylpropionic acid transporter